MNNINRKRGQKLVIHSKFWIGSGNRKPKLPKPVKALRAGYNVCKGCKQELPATLDYFYKLRDGLTPKCNVCMRTDQNAYYFWRRYRLTLEERKYLIEEQNSSCSLCELITDKLRIDYNYDTKTIRGMVCELCSLFLNTNSYRLERLASYFSPHGESKADPSSP